jgi:hypothetical protein
MAKNTKTDMLPSREYPMTASAPSGCMTTSPASRNPAGECSIQAAVKEAFLDTVSGW